MGNDILKRWRREDARIKNARDIKQKILNEAHESHPLKNGDVVEVNGYSYRGFKMKVFMTQTVAARFGEGIVFIARGTVYNATGKTGKRIGEWSQIYKD